jgi:single-strand DNA-binding protein
MANLNKVILIGRLTRDPEIRTFGNGGRVAAFGFAVTNRKKNSQTGEWEDDPMFIDCDAFNRGEFGKLADTIERYCHKGSQICIEGRLHLDRWDDKTTGQKRSKHKIVVDQMQLLDPRQDSGGEGGMSKPAYRPAPASASNTSGPSSGGYDSGHDHGMDEPPPPNGTGDDVPF